MEVEFKKASYKNRLFAFAIDLFCMVVTALGLMSSANAISRNFPYYKEANNNINNLQLQSHLYETRKDGTAQLMCDYYNPSTEEEYKELNPQFDEALTTFFSDPQFFDQDDPKSGLYLYNIEKIPEGQTSSTLFIYEDETHQKIIPQESAGAKELYTFYSNVMANNAYKYLINNEIYIKASRTINLNFIFFDLLLPIVLSTTIFELIIPLCFSRGKKTLGKLAFKLSVVDVRGLSCPWPRYLLRFTIFLFLEIIMSVVLFIPLIVSFSMMVFSKRGQSFHDYVCNTYVVEASSSSICKTEEEYIAKHNRDVNFSITKEDVAL